MSHRTFIIADPHYLHGSLFKFKAPDGVTPLRPLWDNPEAMTEDMIKWHNELVRPVDKTYFLGDIVMKKPLLDLVLPRLNGHKVLIKGNHDIAKPQYYLKYFKDIRAYHRLAEYWMTHIPIHPSCLGRVKGVFHGHIHARTIMLSEGVPDTRYFCVSAEQTNYRPLEWEHAKELFKKRQEAYGQTHEQDKDKREKDTEGQEEPS